VEPGLALGATIVIGYGISERLLPGVLHFSQTAAAFGRLEQPLTYWNAMGELAALGLVLCARLLGDARRPRPLRLLAAAASAPLGMGLYLSFSRGALFAWVAGLVALLVAAPRREQLRGLLVGAGAAVLAAAAAAPFKGLTALTGTLATRERQGVAVLVLLAGIVLSAVIVAWQLIRTERPGALPLPRRAPRLALALICVGLAVAIVAGAKEGHNRPLGGGAGRLVTFTSNRYAYWDVALRAFSQEPLHGIGAGNWSVWWLRYRTVNEFATDAHSLPLETAAELGLVGLALLVVVVTGVALAARAAHRRGWALAAGPIAGLVAYAAHGPLDWDWQMPAVTLIAIALAGAVLAQAEDARVGAGGAQTASGA
jgi:O-antigen ligase